MSLENLVKYYNRQDLSGEDIERLLGKPPVLYSTLPNFKSMDDLLGKERYCVLLYQTSSINNGHYVAITANDEGVVRFCDSYGFTPAQIRNYTAYDDQFPTYVIDLLHDYQVEYNTTDYQQKKGSIATCGRWATIFCRLRNLSLVQIKQLFTTNRSDFLRDTDNCATLLTLLQLDNIEEFFQK